MNSIVTLTLWLLGGAAYSQELVRVEPMEVHDHRIGSPALIHSSVRLVYPQQDTVTLNVIVDAAGNVESAEGAAGPEEFFIEAANLEAKQKFKPFKRDRAVVRASFLDHVSIVPPEKWAETSVPFPEVEDWNTLRMTLKRTRCFGPCPAYSVEVRGDGDVEFDGTGNVLATGHHRSAIPKSAVEELLAAFRRANYFSLEDQYAYPVTDNPTYTTSIEFDGNEKSVRDYVGLRAGMPTVVRDVENAIDQIAGTEKWVKGNAETGAALVAEKWDFQADTEENRALFARVVARGPEELIQLFITNGAPALSMTKQGEGALISAAGNGNLELVRLILRDQAGAPAALLSCALGAAASSGNLGLVQFLIEKGGKPNGPPCGMYEKATVLMKATESWKAEMVEEILKQHPDIDAKDANGFTALAFFLERAPPIVDTQKIANLLLAAGANVNSRDDNERTPIFYACMNQHPDGIRTLIAAGADVNAKDLNGQTVLMSCFVNPSVKAIIDSGADLTVRNRFGRTAAEEARQMGAIDKAQLLETAMKKRTQKQ